jgi:hypothetical protein
VFQVLDLVLPKKYVQVMDLDMKTCSNGHERLELQNIHAFNNREEEIVISGIVNIMTFLSAPITVRSPYYVSDILALLPYYLLTTVILVSPTTTGSSEIKLDAVSNSFFFISQFIIHNLQNLQ